MCKQTESGYGYIHEYIFPSSGRNNRLSSNSLKELKKKYLRKKKNDELENYANTILCAFCSIAALLNGQWVLCAAVMAIGHLLRPM